VTAQEAFSERSTNILEISAGPFSRMLLAAADEVIE
jgi:hypothetical protein